MRSLILFLLCVTLWLGSSVATSQEARDPERDPETANGVANRDRSRVRRISTQELLTNAIMSQGDVNADDKLSRNELARLADRWYAALDVGRAGELTQEEFLQRFGDLVPSPPRPGRSSDSGSLRPNRYLGLCVAVDADRDGSIRRAEFIERFGDWFDSWDREKRGYLNRDTVLSGLRAALPRTNMGTGTTREEQERPAALPQPPPSPVLSPSAAAKTIRLARGFHIELAAAEPMIEDPIACSFDADGRLYVVELRSYMLDIDGTNERAPMGRISRLEDVDHDGRFDTSTVFVDQLILPRSVAAVHGGVLFVADYKLHFARDTDGDGRADRTVLVDEEYGGGNIEHAPNGLMTAMDNWIYNARSRFRYRWFGDVLVKQPTVNRGQWGITQDNYGRLFYNVNNSQLLGDYTPPNYMNRNAHHPTTAGMNLFVATDQRVFPIRMNTAVNRGYLPDVLDASGKLYVFASSCSPVIYRGDNFPADFVGNAFVCDSAANLIKRNLVFDHDLTLTSKFAYEDSEFLAATDERFRPVSLTNGPDGTLWAVDMYRGINQYAMFMTDYLRKESLERGLDKGIHLGRIYRIVSDEKTPSRFPRLSQATSKALVDRLSHPNGWIRDTAQRLLVQRADPSVIPDLIQLVSEGAHHLGRIHGLWTLEGMSVALAEPLPPRVEAIGSLDPGHIQLVDIDSDFTFSVPPLREDVLEACYEALGDGHLQVQIAAIRVAEALTQSNPEHQAVFRGELERLVETAPPEVLFQIALTGGNLDKPDSLPLLVDVVANGSDQFLLREAIVSGLYRWEVPYLKALLADPRMHDETPGKAALLRTLATAIMRERHPANIDELLTMAAGEATAEAAWRTRNLLAGMTVKIGSRSKGPVRMKAAPKAFAQLSEFRDPDTPRQIDQIKLLLAWPGHQFDRETRRASGPPLTPGEQQLVAAGKTVFQKVCAGCHGLQGEGIRPLAAPLVDSDWVLGSEDRLIRVLLHGLTGPVEVDGIAYQPPIVLPEMPSMRTLDDTKISAVLSYVRRAWGHEGLPVSADKVASVRQATQGRDRPWTAAELSKYAD